ncbi:MAG: NTP transferase domain-containing protein, partial [Silvibacterium sp.]|nr:NTP transferase domain-containing protein [Silvibacterium sp.]
MSAPLCNNRVPALALLAGGFATRLGSLAARVPKSLLEVAGEPFIGHQLRRLASQGVRDVVICCGHFGEQIESFVGKGSQFGCRVRYSRDGTTPLGTGGAIRKALPLLGSCFGVMYGDSFLMTPFKPVLDAFSHCAKPALITVFANANRWDKSNVLFEDGIVLRYDKWRAEPGMRHIDYGLSFFSAAVFQQRAEGEVFDLADLQRQLVEEGKMAA